MQHPAGPDVLYGNLVQGELVPIGRDETDAPADAYDDGRWPLPPEIKPEF